jgi:anti-anti-sigma factor
MQAHGLHFDLSAADTAVVLHCHGTVDLTTRDAFRDWIDRALAQRGDRRLILDLAGVDFIDSAGLRALMQALLECDGEGTAWTLRPSKQVEGLLLLAGMGRLRSDQTGGWLDGGGYGDL